MEQILLIIPVYEPDQRLITLLADLKEKDAGPVILVNDGSGLEYDNIFSEVQNLIKKDGGMLLTHEVNRGKGRALKTAFQYVLDNFPEITGVVTADSDGQHTVEDIENIKRVLSENPEKLILGIRKFAEKGIPWKSRLGNNLTEKVFSYVSGIHINDTQTGLRGIPREFMRQLLEIEGERFEFEMRMLLEAIGKYEIIEIAIETIYDSEENHQTHFNPIIDSVRIYKILCEKFFKYVFSSFSASIIDLIIFSVFCILLKSAYPGIYILVATVFARIISAIYNYFINYKMVFNSKESLQKSSIRYAILAVVQMGLSAVLVTFLVRLTPILPETVAKLIIDVILFFISYCIQQRYIFARDSRKKC